MESNEHMRVEIPRTIEMHTSPRGSSNHGLTRQPSYGSSKANCLCSPTTHVGSFRCRLHRSPSLQRTKSMDPSPSSTNNDNSSNSSNNPNIIQAQ
ncbi:hypothetical protein vseg_002188 [Gypsophila vaccaria]